MGRLVHPAGAAPVPGGAGTGGGFRGMRRAPAAGLTYCGTASPRAGGPVHLREPEKPGRERKESTVSLPPLVEPAEGLTVDEVRRYSRHLIIPDVGMSGQKRLKNAKVLCVGAGGLGSPGPDVPRGCRRRHARDRRLRRRRRVQPPAPDHPRPVRRRPAEGRVRAGHRRRRSTRLPRWSCTPSGSTPTTR